VPAARPGPGSGVAAPLPFGWQPCCARAETVPAGSGRHDRAGGRHPSGLTTGVAVAHVTLQLDPTVAALAVAAVAVVAVVVLGRWLLRYVSGRRR
jgi:hypothetical protein